MHDQSGAVPGDSSPSTGLAVSAAVPAQAAVGYNLTTGTAYTSDKASAAGSLHFGRSCVRAEGYIRDLCGGDPDGDGYSAVVVFQGVLGNGSLTREKGYVDDNQCGNGRLSYTAVFDPDRRLRSLRITVCEINYSAGGVVGDCARRLVDNPTW